MKRLRVYLETSFWNYLLEENLPIHYTATKNLFKEIISGQIEPYISGLVLEELNQAPEPKKSKMLKLVKIANCIVLETNQEVINLAESYISANVIPYKKRTDALHVAIATVYELDIFVSWNYRHLVSVRKKELINSVNLREGYTKTLEMVTPLEV